MPVAEEGNEIVLQPMSTVRSSGSVYSVARVLSCGTVLSTFVVRSVASPNATYVMKIERRNLLIGESRIKKEAVVLKNLMKRQSGVSHFPRLIDRGKLEEYNFIIVQQLGLTLAELKMRMHPKAFSIGTGIGVSLQSLDAIVALHTAGFVSRDIKPANFAVGLNEQKNLVFIVDFWLTRKFLSSSGNMVEPRPIVGFRGTIKYSPLSGHKFQEQGPKDDCESWLYTFLDLILPSGLPWSNLNTRDDVWLMKEDCHHHKKDLLFAGLTCTSDLVQILNYIDSLAYADRVDYRFINSRLLSAAAVCGVNPREPFDWLQESYPSGRMPPRPAGVQRKAGCLIQ